MKTVQPRKQRKYRFTAPLHIRGHFVHAHLSKELREKLHKRAVRVRKGDKIRIARGRFKGKEGKIMNVDLREGRIRIEGITRRKAKGQEVLFPIDPSNVILVDLVERK